MAEYKMVRLGEICEQINGVSYKPADVYDSLTEKTKILLRANNIFEDKLNYDELVFVDKKRISENQYMKKGDILICASSGSKHLVGKAACLTEDKDLTFGAFCKVLRPKTVNPEYIKHYFFSSSYRTEISRLSEGANINNIKAADLDNLKIPLPSESIQNKIAKRLDKCVKIINNQKKALEKYDILIKSRFIEMFGDPVQNPMGWEVNQLADFIIFLTSGARGWSEYFSKEGDLFLTIKNVKNNKIKIDDVQHIKVPSNKEAERTKVKENDLLISITADLGRTGVVSKAIASYGAYINQHLSLVRLNMDKINPLFVSYFLETEGGKIQFSKKNQSAVKAGLNFDAIKSLHLINPPLSLQNDFASFVQQIDKSKFAVQKSLEKTETLYKSLMQRYFA